MRRIYEAVVIPRVLFWFISLVPTNSDSKMKAGTSSQLFVAIQTRAACLISGAFRMTAAEALNTELNLSPTMIHMNVK